MRQRRGEVDRFWEKVVKGPRPQDCWIWTGAVADDGYGRFWVTRDGEQRALRPQRYAYEHLTGETLHPGIALLHVCDVPLCVHASTGTDTHLLAGTQALNMLDRSQKGRHANASTFRRRGVGCAQFRAQSLTLRTALVEHGWNEPIIRPLLTGVDPEAPMVF
ncbi:hypothetical protein PTW37_16620 (plasmid) [Arthrobacter agilis]|uniref:hypothetical protein n=1 Tax=Arthrobacter agilis TaxID=37921 RepID=UPI002365B16C|nr:hypothetical protein [Arthrobacter agilis]WDF35124.1 hypothetical protein PTW37_16620 [Arthrobacter agilis]